MPKKNKPVCPMDGTPLEEIGSIGIQDVEARWDAQAERLRCPKGHMIFVCDAERIDEAELEEIDGHDDEDYEI